MPEKIEIMYDFIKEGEEKMEEHKLKSITSADVKRVLELIDVEGIDIEAIIDGIKKLKGGKKEMTDLTDDERFSKEEKKVEKYLSEHKGVSYRDAVIAVLDRTEPKPKKEPTKEEITKRENLKACQNYISANPRASWKEAVRVVLRGEELTLQERLIEEYLEKNPGSDYKTAVIESLSILEKEPKEE